MLTRGTGAVFLLGTLLLSTLLCSLLQPLHATQLEKGDPVYQGHCRWGASSEKGHNKMLPVQISARVDSATQCVENFVGGKFHDTTTKTPHHHENNEN